MKKLIPERMVLKFQHWLFGMCAVLVLALTGAFLWIVFSKFGILAETDATEKFDLIAGHAIGQINADLINQRRFIEITSSADVGMSGSGRSMVAESLVPTLVKALTAQESRYSIFYGFAGGNFLQVILVKDNPQIRTALNAPEGTDHAVRIIRRHASGERTENWSFRDKSAKVLDSVQIDSTFDPTTRSWYQDARVAGHVIVSAPYKYGTSGAMGLSLAAPIKGNDGVFGVDITLAAMSELLQRFGLTDNAAAVVLDQDNNILAMRSNNTDYPAPKPNELANLKDNTSPVLRDALAQSLAAGEAGLHGKVMLDGRPFIVSSRAITPIPGKTYRMLVLAPLSDFTGVLENTRLEMLLMAGGFLLILIPVGYFGTKKVVLSLAALARHSEQLRRLDFSSRPKHIHSLLYEVNALGHAQEVMHDSILQRTAALEIAKSKLAQLVEGGIALGRETNREKLLRSILFRARDIADCSAATLFLRTDDGHIRIALHTSEEFENDISFPIAAQPLEGRIKPVVHVARTGETLIIDNIDTDNRFDLSGVRAFGKSLGIELGSLLSVPLTPHKGEVLGVLQLLSVRRAAAQQPSPFEPEVVGFVEALAAQSAVALENQSLIKAQKELMDAIIRLVAGAVDAKSAYTGGHCERVPELAMMLAQEACNVTRGPLADFGFRTEEEWHEFRVGAWLHDCGKVTTPEYVVDKATKLETIYNRIHEVRTRFEVLLRDAEIATLKTIAAGADATSAWAEFESRKKQLQEDFAFVADANVGAEFMAPDKMERVRAIASQPWLRHFDDRLGLAHDELSRLGGEPAPALPAAETLLADKTGHIVPRPFSRALDPKYGFKVKVPEHLYNRGEVYNLCISRGTLTEEERFKINEHIIQTIVMLDAMPFPKHMQRVPEYAGTHHETLTGSGYPRKLDGSELSIPARIMAIADIFEALTAADRPYKKAKTLSESVKVLSFFKKDGHIDPVLFDLFLTSGVYRTYGERFLHPSQMDEVDILPYLTPHVKTQS
jgi:HD-GYP domain-containing protein (c-di-GMP phosphodiesterase class II)